MGKIANGQYCVDLLNGDDYYFKDKSKCPTKTQIDRAYGLNVNGTYEDNQLVQLSDIEVGYQVDCDCTFTNDTSRFINPRIDSDYGRFSLTAGIVHVNSSASQTVSFVVKYGVKYDIYVSIGYGNVCMINSSGISFSGFSDTYRIPDAAIGKATFTGGTTYIQVTVMPK